MSELLPCPFCGGEADYLPDFMLRPSGPAYYVMCHFCNACADSFETKEEAAKAWNTRAKDARIAELEAALRGLVDGKEKIFCTRVETTIEHGHNVNAEHKKRVEQADKLWTQARAALERGGLGGIV